MIENRKLSHSTFVRNWLLPQSIKGTSIFFRDITTFISRLLSLNDFFLSFYFQSLVKAFENRTKDEDPGQRLPVIFPGCLLNFCNETPQAVETLAKFKCASSVLKNILNTKTNDAVFNSSILFIHAMVECETGVRFFSSRKSFHI